MNVFPLHYSERSMSSLLVHMSACKRLGNFAGYWKDGGTIDSLWESNMDLLDPNVPFDVWDNSWKIYSRTHNVPPQYVGPQAVVENSMVSEGCVVDGYVDFSVLFQSVVVEEGATVGQRPENIENMDNWGIAVLGNGVKVGAKLSVPAKGMIYEDVKEAE